MVISKTSNKIGITCIISMLVIMGTSITSTPVFGADNPYLRCPDCNDTSNIQQIPSTGVVTVTTNKQSYNNEDTLTISGSVQDYVSDTPVTVRIMSPTGLMVKIDQVDVNSDRTYSESISPSNINWQGAGTYKVMVQYGSPDRLAQTTFQFIGISITQTGNSQNSPPPPNNSTGNLNNSYTIHTQNQTTQTTVSTTPVIPHWVKTVFNLYGQGQISDDDLISALRFLIQAGVIRVS